MKDVIILALKRMAEWHQCKTGLATSIIDKTENAPMLDYSNLGQRKQENLTSN